MGTLEAVSVELLEEVLAPVGHEVFKTGQLLHLPNMSLTFLNLNYHLCGPPQGLPRKMHVLPSPFGELRFLSCVGR